MPTRTRTVIATVVAAAVLLTSTADASASTALADPPSRYRVSTILGGLHRPWDAAFTPDGSLLFTERIGRVNLLRSGRRSVLGSPSDALAIGEGGMMGLAVDPAFASNRRIYVCFMSDAGASIDVRIVRWRVAGDWSRLRRRRDLVTGIPTNPAGQRGRHSGCRLAFGPDGKLWITTGDAAVGSNPQNPRSLAGKVLRINTDGSIPRGNMRRGRFRQQIYAYGFRNPQGISFRPRDGRPFIIEHGPSCDDEITGLFRGANGGWNPSVPGNSFAYDESVPMTDRSRYPTAALPSWRSGCPTIAPSGGTFLRSQRWGSYRGRLAVAVLKGQQLRVHRAGPPRSAAGGGVAILTGHGRLRTAVEGPRGALYVLQDADPGSILRVAPVD
jgi:glucose/arabinose dehydrogenase